MRLVASCLAPTTGALRERLARSAGRLRADDFVEARLDRLLRPVEPEEFEALARAAGGRLLVCCRPGGSGTPSTEPERVALLERALSIGAAVDVEAGTAAAALAAGARGRERRGRILASTHLSATGPPPSPAEAAALMRKLVQTGAALLKLAAPSGDAFTALAWMEAAREAAPGPAVSVVPLGPGGRGLRLLAGRGLSELLYCAEGEPTGDGQPGLDDTLDSFAAEAVEGDTPVFAVVGHPLEASWSPLLHSRLLRARGRPGLLVALPVEDHLRVLPLLERLGVHAAAVTMPHKGRLAQAGLRLSNRARRASSVNSLRRGLEGWEAESFDGLAALEAIEERLPLEGRRVAIVGAGGAAAALGAELVERGIALTLLARRPEQARLLAGRLGLPDSATSSFDGRDGREALDGLQGIDADVVVNATPADPCEPIARRAAFDMRSTPADTDWLRRAAARGLSTIDGLSMFARQATAQQHWWGVGEGLRLEQVEGLLRGLVAERGGAAS